MYCFFQHAVIHAEVLVHVNSFILDTDSDYSPRATAKKKRAKSVDSPSVSDTDVVRKKRKKTTDTSEVSKQAVN